MTKTKIKPPKKNNAISRASLAVDGVEGLNQIGVDRENRVIKGRVVAKLGTFKTRRGQFTMESLEKLVELGNSKDAGVRGRFRHPGLSNDGLGTFLSRDRNFRLDGDLVRADSYISKTAMKSPPDGGGTPYGEYVLGLVEEDSEAISSSIVLSYKPQFLRDEDGEKKRDDEGELEPPIWIPTELHAVDVVDEGDAVDGFLSVDQLSENDRVVRNVTAALDSFFDDEELTAETIRDRGNAFLETYLTNRYGEDYMSDQKDQIADLLDANAKLVETVGKLTETLSQPPVTDVSASTETAVETQEELESEVDNKQTVEDINALCAMTGREDLSGGFIAQVLSGDKTVDQIKKELISLRAEENKLDTSNPTNVQPAAGGSTQSIDDQLKAEYEENKDVYQQVGLGFESFAKDRKIEMGLEPETSPLMGAARPLI